MKKFKNKNLTASSKNWISRQFSDPYTKLAKQKGYRSRSAFKLIEINQKFKFLKNNLNIVDLGSAPGGWSQVCSEINIIFEQVMLHFLTFLHLLSRNQT